MYDLVWASPLIEVARKLGLSEWTPRNLCDYHRVPFPRPAYWRNLAAGKRVKQTTFASTADPQLELITLDPSKAIAPEVTEALARQRDEAKRLSAPRAPKPLAETTGWEPLKVVHPSLAVTARSLRAAKADDDGIVRVDGQGVVGISCATNTVERALFILDSLLRRLEQGGMSCTIKDKEVLVARGQEDLRFSFGETIVRKPHVPTVEDLKTEARRLRNGGSASSFYWNKAYPEFDRVPTGQLFISITVGGYCAPQRNWRDGVRSSLLDQLGNVVDAFDTCLKEQLTRRIESERRERLWQRREENRVRADKRQKREEARLALIDEIVVLRTQSEQLSEWIEWAASNDNADTRRMVSWARERLQENQRALDPASFGDWLRKHDLFPETDPIAPLPEDPDTPNQSGSQQA